MDKKKIIEEYLFEGTPEEKKEKFELAWDIMNHFEDIKLSMRESILRKLVEKIKEKTKNPSDPLWIQT